MLSRADFDRVVAEVLLAAELATAGNLFLNNAVEGFRYILDRCAVVDAAFARAQGGGAVALPPLAETGD